MFKTSDIHELIKLLDSTSITEFEVESEGKKLTIKKECKTVQVPVMAPVRQAEVVAPVAPVTTVVSTEAPSAPVAPKAVDANLHEIKSPMVGTFYSSPAPDADAYVKVGDQVTQKDVICIIEAMKLMNEIEAECKGVIVEVCVENGQLVEYGQTLFKVRKD